VTFSGQDVESCPECLVDILKSLSDEAAIVVSRKKNLKIAIDI